jgi:hypothetical protein
MRRLLPKREVWARWARYFWGFSLILALGLLGIMYQSDVVQGSGGLQANEGDVYYIDFESGDDSRDGRTAATAWKHIPGTKTGDNWSSPYIAENFGQGTFIAGSNRVKPGTKFKIKSGSTYGAGTGGTVVIDEIFYEAGTMERPVVIERDPSWGNGPIVFDAREVDMSQWDGMFQVHQSDYVTLDGITPGGIVIQNCRHIGVSLMGQSKSKPMVGVQIKNIKVEGCGSFGMAAQYLSDFLIENCEIDGKGLAGNGGFHFGEGYCEKGIFKNCIAHDLGDVPGSQSGGTDLQIGFWTTNSRDITYINCTAYNNEGDGFDVGLVNASEDTCTDTIKYINCTSYNNADGFGANAGEDLEHNEKIYYINSIAYDNAFSGFHAYGGTAEYFYTNCIAHNNFSSNWILGPDGWDDDTPVTVHLYNSIGYKPQTSIFPRSNLTTTYIAGNHFTLDSDYNYWGYQSPDEICFYWDAYAGDQPYASVFTYQDGPGDVSRDWYLLDEEGHLYCDGNSLNKYDGEMVHFVDEENHDYHLRSTSNCIGRGLDLSTKDWYIPEMGFDKEGRERHAGSIWDIGPYEYPASALLGDVNGDGRVDEEDIRACVDYILAVRNWGEAADANRDGKVDVLDVQWIVGILSQE